MLDARRAAEASAATQSVALWARPIGLGAALVVLAVAALTLVAGLARVQGLDGPDGRLDKDEARIALAADGVRSTGLPIMPSGRLYTRGLLNSYLMAGSFSLAGRGDLGARLPSALAGALLVPAVFVLGRALAGSAAGLAAASCVALARPLVDVARSAWMPSVFLVLFVLAVYACYRGFVERRGVWQVAAAAIFCLALLSYEFAVLLLAALGLHVCARAGRVDWSWYRGRATLLAFVIFGGGLALFVFLALALRSGTLAGALGEVRAFVAPEPDFDGVAFYWKNLLAEYRLLFVPAVLGLIFLARGPGGALFLGGLLVLAFLVPSFLLPLFQVRYAAPVLPLLAALAACGAVRTVVLLFDLAAARLSAAPPAAWQGLTAGVVALALLVPTLQPDLATALRRARQGPSEQTWLQVIRQQGLQPTDLLVVERPEVVYFYLGHAEYYFRTEGFERYTYRDDGATRYLYTGSLLLAERGDFARLVESPNAGRAAWVISRGEHIERRAKEIEPRLWPALTRAADVALETKDDWTLLRVRLPLRG